MVTSGAKREAVAHSREHHGVSERRACALVVVSRRVIRYEPTRSDDRALWQRLRELAAERRRFGYRRLDYLLAREGITPNHKKLLRIGPPTTVTLLNPAMTASGQGQSRHQNMKRKISRLIQTPHGGTISIRVTFDGNPGSTPTRNQQRGGMEVAQRRGMRRAIVAVARRLAVVLHRRWTDGTDFRWDSEPGTSVAVAFN